MVDAAKTPALGVVFDLDDTLYLERDYVRSGFRAVAEDAVAGTSVSPDEASKFLWDGFLAGVRGSSFNDLLTEYPDIAARRTIPDLVRVYREHPPTIDFLPGAEALLQELKGLGVPLAVITDGPLESQAAKAEALGVARISYGPQTQRVALTALQDLAIDLYGDGVIPASVRALN